ncbi:hypothetical protein GCM10010211_29450 [Streptomyces albospinus]|uniref:Uncharacterized protein n=1 Tax=Streptomyces albospinus TaxID=285515 RepID=A0ABQ2V433_9ACTN|nr:hypothetical protein GCM10010211_29450 [Streptomyces albospinus]
MVVELEFLLGGEMPADAEVRGIFDELAVVGNAQAVADHFAGFQRDERIAAEEAGAHGRPLRFTRRVIEVDLVDGAYFRAVPVERFAADEASGIDIGLHGPSNWSQLPCDNYETAHFMPRPLEGSFQQHAGRLAVGRRPHAGESFVVRDQGAEGANPPRNLSGTRTARVRSLWKAGRVTDRHHAGTPPHRR